MILAVLQARVSSTRLPQKVIKPILGKPMLALQIERIMRAKQLDKLIVATSIQDEDDIIADLCIEMGIECYRGSLDDVLDRFYQAAYLYNPAHVVRLTGDCPLTDPEVIDTVIIKHLAGNFDYTSNVLTPTYPDGLDVEVMRFSCLEHAWREARSKALHEHVTLFIHQQPGIFKLGSVQNACDLSHFRWTVDEPADFELIKNIYENLYENNQHFNLGDILQYLRLHPELINLNSMYERNEGLKKYYKCDEP